MFPIAGNPSDKILYPRTSKRRSSSFPTPRSLERRHSLRLFGSSKRLQRCASTRSLSKTYAQTLNTDSSSSEYQSTDSSSPSTIISSRSLGLEKKLMFSLSYLQKKDLCYHVSFVVADEIRRANLKHTLLNFLQRNGLTPRQYICTVWVHKPRIT